MPWAHGRCLDFKHYFKQVYEASISSGKALKSLTSKLQSVGSTLSEPVNQPERVFKAHVAYDVSRSVPRDTFGPLITSLFSDQDTLLVTSLVSLIPDVPAPDFPKATRGV